MTVITREEPLLFLKFYKTFYVASNWGLQTVFYMVGLKGRVKYGEIRRKINEE